MRIIDKIDHRPWPLPEGPWIQAQTWNDLLFAHWPVARDDLREKIPPGMELDTFEGEAWLGITPFWMSGVRMRGLPPVPLASQFPELNVRTYVRVDGKPGIFFFSLDAGNALAVTAARSFFFLPYFNARMSVQKEGNRVYYSSSRTDNRGAAAEFTGSYEPTSDVYAALPGTLDHWLTERYCLYTMDPQGYLCRGNIHHFPWPLQLAEAEISKNTMAAASEIRLTDRPPLLHYAHQLETLIGPLERIGETA